jgi:hypothetical protein
MFSLSTTYECISIELEEFISSYRRIKANIIEKKRLFVCRLIEYDELRIFFFLPKAFRAQVSQVGCQQQGDQIGRNL